MAGEGEGVSWGTLALGVAGGVVGGFALGVVIRGAAADAERSRTLERVKGLERAVGGAPCRDQVWLAYARWLRTKPGGYQELQRMGFARPEEL
jgi:hypothetical protein